MEHGNDSSAPRAGPELIAWVLDRYASALELYARQLCDCADDVVQEALIQLSRQRPTPSNLLPWLYRVVRNRALSASRSARRRKHHEQRVAVMETGCFQTHMDNALDARAAQQALATLTQQQREVIVAHVWGGLTFAEIGRLVGVTDSTAHRRYQAGLLDLRKRLEATWPEKTNS